MSEAIKADGFYKTFQKDGHYTYRERLGAMAGSGSHSVVVEYGDLLGFDVDLANKLQTQPEGTLDLLRRAAIDALKSENGAYGNEVQSSLKVRIRGLPPMPFRQVTVGYLGQLFSVSGIVIRASERKNILLVGVFSCQEGHVSSVEQTDDVLRRPNRCEHTGCTEKHPVFELMSEKSTFADYQIVRIQELGEDLPAGQLPRGFDVTMVNDMVDFVKPGDHAIITGIMKAVHEPFARSTSRIFGSDIECNYAEVQDKEDNTDITKADIEMFRKMATDPDAYPRLIQSVAPSIIGHNDVKEAILLQQVGGNLMVLEDGSRRRGDIHLLLAGDPSTAKSQMLLFASRLAQRGVLAGGRGSSAAGLSAGIIKINDQSFLEIGVLPMADKGIACIDEWDKMRAEDRSAMHEMMEQQTVTISKAGFHTTLNARAAVLAALNPVGGVYNPKVGFMENVDLPPALQSRIDLTMILRDTPEKSEDERLARHIVGLHEKQGLTITPPVEFMVLKKYVAYAKHLKPALMPEASDKIVAYFMDLRRQWEGEGVPVTPRTIESLIRLATARAKILLKDKVTAEDAEEAVSLMQGMVRDVLTDPKTNKPDFGIVSGVPKEQASKQQIAAKVLSELNGEVVTRQELKNRMVLGGLSVDDAEKMIGRFYLLGKLIETQPGKFRAIS